MDKFEAATEKMAAVSLEAMVEHMERAGLNQKQCRAVERLLEGGSAAGAPPPGPKAVTPISAAGPSAHEASRAPSPLLCSRLVL